MMNQNNEMMNRKTSVILPIIVTAVVVAILGFMLANFMLIPPQTQPPPIPESDRFLMDIYLKVKTIVSLVNMVLILSMMSIYYDIYRQVKSKFTLGLIIVMSVLLMYALTSNPLIHVLFGYQAQNLGPFAMMPDIFTTFALGLLLYISLD